MNGLNAKEDGRRLRSADSRRRIIAAMLSLIQEGTPEPAAEAVAQRAGVGLRTVFRLFSDIESVCAEMLVPQRQEFVDCFSRPFTAPQGAPRIRELFARLAALYEKRMPLRRAGTLRRYRSPSLAAGMKELDRTIDQFVRRQMPGRIGAGPISYRHVEFVVELRGLDAAARRAGQERGGDLGGSAQGY